MTRLSRLLGVLGAKELARRLGRAPSTVQRWTRSGVPAAARDDLREVERRRARARAAAATREEQARKKREAEEKRKKAREAARVEVERRKEVERKKREAQKKREAEKAREVEKAREKAREAKAREAKKKREAEEQRRAKELEEKRRKEREDKARKEREERARREAERRRLEEIARREYEKRQREEREEKARRQAEAKKKAREEKERKVKEDRARKEKERLEEEKRRKAERSEEREKRRKLLEEACRLLISNRSIAEAIGVDEATIRRWMKNPPTEDSKAFEKLNLLVLSIHTLSELMKQAGEIGKLPRVRSGYGKRSGRKTEGVYWTRTFMGYLDDHLLASIEKWIADHHAKYPFWQAVAITSQYMLGGNLEFNDISPKTTDLNYKTIHAQVGNQKWGNFAAERLEPTAQQESAKAAAADMEHRLRQRMESGVVQVFVHGVTLFGYRRRSKPEEVAWSTGKRKEGKKKQWPKKK